MKSNVIALAGALLALTAAAAQASPASVVPDTVHAIGRDATQVFNGTKKGVTDQYDHAKAAAVRTTDDVRHGTVLKHHHRRRLVRKTVHKHTVVHHD
jgi:hypothetical protein